MAVMPEKLPVLKSELARLASQAKPNDTLLDFNLRHSPGPMTDQEFEDFILTLDEPIDRRNYSVANRDARLVAMTRRGSA